MVLETLPADSPLHHDPRLLCCPEDHVCKHDCVSKKLLCRSCEIPLCAECKLKLETVPIVPKGLANDNWHGYVDAWIYEQKVTWMEKTCSSPYWTGMTLFEIGVQRGSTGGRKKHKMNDPLFQNQGVTPY